MKIECTVEEIKEVLDCKEQDIKIDGRKVAKQIQPSILNIITSLE